jgi:hypothetical protein
MPYRELMRRKLLEQIYDKMSDEEKRTFVQLTLQDRDHREIMDALQKQQIQISRVVEKVEKQSFALDFGSDILANFTTDGLIWLASKLFRRR